MDGNWEKTRESDAGAGPIEIEIENQDAIVENLDAPHPAPVFYDEGRKRWPWFLRAAATGLTLVIIGCSLLVVSLFAQQFLPRVPLPRVVLDRDLGNLEPGLSDHERRKLIYIQKQTFPKEAQTVKQEDERRAKLRQERRLKAEAFARSAGANPNLIGAQTNAPVVAGFYVNWQQTAYASTHRNIQNLTHFIPEWLHLKPAGSNYADPSPNNRPFIDAREKQDREDITPFVQAHNVPIVPLLNNFTRAKGEEGTGAWDQPAVHQLVSNPKARANLISQVRDWLLKEKMQGINIDFEEVNVDDRANLVVFMKELYAALNPHNLLVTQDIQLEAEESFDYKELARYNDWVVPMFYDQHDPTGGPGPVAGVDWTKTNLDEMLSKIPANKIVMGVGNQAYDWKNGTKGAADLTYQSAIVTCKESLPDSEVVFDPDSLNPMFQYSEPAMDKNGKEVDEEHTVWMQDAVSVYNQLTVGKQEGVRGAALWFVGSEDPSLWSFYNSENWGADWNKIVRTGALNTISYSGQGEVTFEGEGELLQPLTPPGPGRRTVHLDPETGLITSEHYDKDPKTGQPLLPSSYILRRYGGTEGNEKKQIVLSFDDGPDPEWTPKILDILKENHVPGVFFLVGENAWANQSIVRRMWNEGHEIGNHSWSHPDLFKLAPEIQRLQLVSTQRIIQSVTGHSTILFRPPYGGDVEPRTGREVGPMEAAGDLGYVTVGEKNDPQDWRLFDFKPGTEAQDLNKPRDYEDIVRSVVVNRDVGSIVLLHDAGGDRSHTVAALPEIIHELKAKGYTFVSVSDLWGQPKARLMPLVTGRNRLLVDADNYVFEVGYFIARTLATLFTLSIILGVSRVSLFVLLALIQRYKEKRRVFPVGAQPSVSVVIAAYNEEKVIARTVQALLDGDYPNLEILVVDDGSQDRTSEVVQQKFGNEPKVRLFQKPNGGKSTALNRGIQAARGDIIVSLDADTLFAPDTISRLVRHFADPAVGAVSGNVRVGNTHNIWTRWQSLEYITSQNFDRRGYDLLNCITVVPGAVGALRREAVMAVGGYTSDTLAEDTDLTWKLRRAGWRIVNDNSAMAYTEAPETLKNLAKQRYRWAYGTLQCLWKHRAAVGHHGAFGWLALPSLWLYQILFPAISPFMDIAMLHSVFAGNFQLFFTYFAAFSALEFAGAIIAIRMDKGDMRLLPWLLLQRFVYRQLMYYVILKSIFAAIRGGAVGWNKLERTGKARIEGKPAG